jgi:hypothetical protein
MDTTPPLLGNLPRLLLRAEGAIVAAPAITLCLYADDPWWLLVVLALAPSASSPRQIKPAVSGPVLEMELAGLEPATSWVRYRPT